eukprot:COSAG01_NODE_3764_length_5719_cov_9.441815_3_plen_80_part_00
MGRGASSQTLLTCAVHEGYYRLGLAGGSTAAVSTAGAAEDEGPAAAAAKEHRARSENRTENQSDQIRGSGSVSGESSSD